MEGYWRCRLTGVFKGVGGGGGGGEEGFVVNVHLPTYQPLGMSLTSVRLKH